MQLGSVWNPGFSRQNMTYSDGVEMILICAVSHGLPAEADLCSWGAGFSPLQRPDFALRSHFGKAPLFHGPVSVFQLKTYRNCSRFPRRSGLKPALRLHSYG